jgi:succinate dehydrogenase/fumarate reductase iron-sulfur protein
MGGMDEKRDKDEKDQKTITVKVARFDPDTDETSWWQTYEVPLREGMSVLDTLDYVYEHLDPTLAYYDHAACAQGICKTCTVKIDGKPALMCQTLVTGDVTVEPAGRLPVVRDLVTRKKERAS